MKNFGEFYDNQIAHAGAIVLSRTQKMTEEKLSAAVALLREKNPGAAIITTPWDQLEGSQILSAMDGREALAQELLDLARSHRHEHHHDHDHGHEHEHEHHHEHDHDHHEEHEHSHEHHHEHGEACACGCHDHDHHHHDHDADEVFTSWGVETPKTFTEAEIDAALSGLDSGKYGTILRAKGIVPAADGAWLHFDYVPEEHEVRRGGADYTGRLCVIGSELDEAALKTLFGV